MEKSLVIMAAGMGSRFGGLKQMTPFGPNGEFLIDYSVYDAIKAGFNKIVFVIKDEIAEDFKNTVGKRVEKHIKVEYVYQDVKNIPVKKEFNRSKPWGTGHAILSCKDVINDNFAVINADDFYDRDAFLKASSALEKVDDKKFALIGYEAINTLTENGTVKRGVCNLNGNYLDSLIESTLERKGDLIHAVSLVDSKEFDISFNTLVSMNMLLFSPKIFEYLENDFKIFLENIKDEEKDEILIPEVMHEHIKNGDIRVEVIRTSSKWFGVTYKEDSDKVKTSINKMIEKNKYPNNLWS